METSRIDQDERTINTVNPLDLHVASDKHWYTPVTISENQWLFVNPEIEKAPVPKDIAVTRSEWEEFIEGFGTEEEFEDQSWTEDLMDTIVDERQFLYTPEDYGYTPETYEDSMNAYIEEAENDEFDRFLPDAISYEDIHDFLNNLDDGSDDEHVPKWIEAIEASEE